MSKKITFSKALREGLHEEMVRDENVFIIGEDMAVMGNVFGVTTGFLDEFGPNRVIDTPISEEGFCGMAVGAAMRGLRPVVELMYNDFITVAADPIFNQAAKTRYMTGGQATVPMVLRCPMGAGRRNAGHHSQSLEALFCHFPGLKVIAPSCAEDAKGLIKSAIRDDDPVVSLENKLLYAKKEEIPEEEYWPTSASPARRWAAPPPPRRLRLPKLLRPRRPPLPRRRPPCPPPRQSPRTAPPSSWWAAAPAAMWPPSGRPSWARR